MAWLRRYQRAIEKSVRVSRSVVERIERRPIRVGRIRENVHAIGRGASERVGRHENDAMKSVCRLLAIGRNSIISAADSGNRAGDNVG